MRHDVSLEILIGRERTAVGIAKRLTELNPESAENAYLLGEAHRRWAAGPSAPAGGAYR